MSRFDDMTTNEILDDIVQSRSDLDKLYPVEMGKLINNSTLSVTELMIRERYRYDLERTINTDPMVVYLRKLLSDLYTYNTSPSLMIGEQHLSLDTLEPVGASDLRVKIEERIGVICENASKYNGSVALRMGVKKDV